ncbi:(2Fe-2S)-binding protein [Rhodococcus sp. NPDC003322]
MYICLCHAITHHTVDEAVSRGARTSKEVAAACGAGSDCGRCRRTVQAIIAAAAGGATGPAADAGATIATTHARRHHAPAR